MDDSIWMKREIVLVPDLPRRHDMKRILQIGSIIALMGPSAMLAAGLMAPQPAGACKCAFPYSEFEIVEVRLIDSNVDDADRQDLIDAETSSWPEEATLSYEHLDFGGDYGDESLWLYLETD